jgi:hypothetical protein
VTRRARGRVHAGLAWCGARGVSEGNILERHVFEGRVRPAAVGRLVGRRRIVSGEAVARKAGFFWKIRVARKPLVPRKTIRSGRTRRFLRSERIVVGVCVRATGAG